MSVGIMSVEIEATRHDSCLAPTRLPSLAGEEPAVDLIGDASRSGASISSPVMCSLALTFSPLDTLRAPQREWGHKD